IYIAALTAIYVRGGSLDMEERFFRPLSLVLLPGVVHALVLSRSRLRLAVAGVAALGVAYGVTSYFVRLDHNRTSLLAERGFRHASLTADARALLRREMAGPNGGGDTVLVVTWPEIALDVSGARIIGFIGGDGVAQIRERTFRGRVSRLYVLVEDRLIAD